MEFTVMVDDVEIKHYDNGGVCLYAGPKRTFVGTAFVASDGRVSTALSDAFVKNIEVMFQTVAALGKGGPEPEAVSK